MTDVSVPTFTLNHGAVMPRFGLGTWPLDDAASESAVAFALQHGYRLIDTAENYRNEVGVGRGIAGSGVPRKDIFLTSKFNKEWHGVDLVEQAFERSAGKLGVDYLDLLLIHWPNPGQDRYVDAWRGLAALLADGRVKAIGTSNFKPAHLQRLIDETGVVPDVNQIQLSPALTRDAARAFHAEHGIVTESWAPIGGQGPSVLGQPIVAELAAKYGRSPAQVVLRWHIDLGLATVAKSANPDRILENLDIFDFALEPDDIAALSALDLGEGEAVNSDDFGH